jgi:hypothetical protein
MTRNPAYADDINFQLYNNPRKQRTEDPDYKVKLQIPFSTALEIAAVVLGISSHRIFELTQAEMTQKWQQDPIAREDRDTGMPFVELRGGVNMNVPVDEYGNQVPLTPTSPNYKGYAKPPAESRRRTIAAERAKTERSAQGGGGYQGGQPRPPQQQQWGQAAPRFQGQQAASPSPDRQWEQADPPAEDGQRESDWIEGSGLSRSTCFELIRAAGITPGSRKVPGSRKPVAWLSDGQLAQLEALAQRVIDGEPVTQVVANPGGGIAATGTLSPPSGSPARPAWATSGAGAALQRQAPPPAAAPSRPAWGQQPPEEPKPSELFTNSWPPARG